MYILVYSKQPLFEVFKELSFSWLECRVHDVQVRPTHFTFSTPCVGFYTLPWHLHQMEVTDGFYCLLGKTH